MFDATLDHITVLFTVKEAYTDTPELIICSLYDFTCVF